MADSISSTLHASKTVDRSKLPSQADAFSSLKIEDFLKLMTTELQNQDPLNPTDNSQLLQQLSQMQSITASNNLTSTLNSVLLGTNLSSGASLIGKGVSGLSDKGDSIVGTVDSVSMKEGKAFLNVVDKKDGKTMLELSLSNVKQVL